MASSHQLSEKEISSLLEEVERKVVESWQHKPTRRRIQRVGKQLLHEPDWNRYRETPLVELDKTRKSFKYIIGHIEQIADDLGGADQLSFSQRALVEQVALCREYVSYQWKAWLEGREEEFDLDKTLKVLKVMRETMRILGLDRKVKEIESLDAIVRGEGE